MKTHIQLLKTSLTKAILTLTLLLFGLQYNRADTFYSQANGNISNLSNWNNASDGSGASPVAVDLTSGLHTFHVQDGDTIVVDQDISILGLVVGDGASGVFRIANDATIRNLTIGSGGITVNNNGTFDVGDFEALHNLTIQGNLLNNGTFDLKIGFNRGAKTFLDGTFTISGNSPQLYDVSFLSGTVTTNTGLDIEGSINIENGAVFDDGNQTHTVAGNWIENGSGQRTGNGTINLDASLIQILNTDATFYNLHITGGATAIVSAQLTITNNLYVSNNSKFLSSNNQIIQGEFRIDDGSSFEATRGRVTLDGSAAQDLYIGTSGDETNAKFYQLYLDNSTKTLYGNLYVQNVFYLYDDATVNDDGNDKIHHFYSNVRLDGTCNFAGQVYLNGGTLYEGIDHTLTIGTAEIFIAGGITIQDDDTVYVNNDITIQDGRILRLRSGTALIGSGTLTLSLEGSGGLQVQDENNFPTGFSTYDFSDNSIVYYDANMNQTVQGNITYGRLYLRYQNKTVTGPLTVLSHLYLYNDVIVYLQNYDHSVGRHIYNSTSHQGSLIATGGSFTLDGIDYEQQLQDNGAGDYIFNDFIVKNNSPTRARRKYIYTNITVNGHFQVINNDGSQSTPLTIELYDNEIDGNNTGTFSLGPYVQLDNNGSNNFANTIASFASVDLDTKSTIRFEAHGITQNIPGITYGNADFYGDGDKNLLAEADFNGNVTYTGRNPIFQDNGLTHTIEGDWYMPHYYVNMTGTLVFDGADQYLYTTRLNHVVFAGTGTKTIDGTLYMDSSLTIQPDVILYANNENIEMQGNWIDNGQFLHNGGTVTFNGDGNQTISATDSSYFYDLRIQKTGSSRLITANSDFRVANNFDMRDNAADFDLNGYTLSLNRHWYVREGSNFIHNNGKILMNGTELQYLYNYNATPLNLFDIEFDNAGLKYLRQGNYDIDGDFISNASVNIENRQVSVAGDWLNNGTFTHSNYVMFDGTDQSISASTFHDIIFANGGIKTLAGNITVEGFLRIQDGAILDVTTNNFGVSVAQHWYNNEASGGIFFCREGTVTFNGNSSNIETGGTGIGKRFYNIIINKEDGQYLRMYSDPDDGSNLDLRVLNDFTLSSGIFYTYNHDMWVGANLIVEENGQFAHNSGSSNYLTLAGTGDTYIFDPGEQSYNWRNIVIDAASATYELNNPLYFYNNYNLTINNGKLDMNHQTIEMVAGDGNVFLNGGILEVDAAAVLKIDNNAELINAGGMLRIIGDSNNSATITNRSGNYDIIQTAGTFAANYFRIESTRNNGVDIQGGNIDLSNSFDNGMFTGGIGNAYITLNGLDLGAGLNASNVVFNSGPTYNVSRTSGVGTITFDNPLGAFSGENYDEDDGDPGTLVDWLYPVGMYWDGGAGTSNWHDAANWVGDTLPEAEDIIYLNNNALAGSYTVRIQDSDVEITQLRMNSSDGVTLQLDGHKLRLSEHVIIGSNDELQQLTANDTIYVAGNWTNEGTFDPGTATVVFNAASGFFTITTQGSADPFYNLEIDATAAVIAMNSDLAAGNNVNLKSGVLDASANYTLYVGGDWNLSGGQFEERSGTVIFNGGDGTTQNIKGGYFYDLIFDNPDATGTSDKVITANLSVGRDLTINNYCAVNGGNKFIYVADDWTNLADYTGFSQTGSGTVIFNGGGGQDIGDGNGRTAFHHVIINGGNNKMFRDSAIVSGDFTMISGNVYIREDVAIIGSGSNSFAQNANTLYVMGADNFPQNFATYNFSGGWVDYYADIDQDIYPATYNYLRVRRENSGNSTTKSLTGDIVVKGDLIINDNETTLDAAGYTITLGRNLGIADGGPQIVWGATGTLIHDGGDWTLDDDISLFNNLILSGSRTKSVRYADIEITGDLSIHSDVSLQIYQDRKMFCSQPGKTFSMLSNGRIHVYTAATVEKAFPIGFDNYSLATGSYTYLRGGADQIIYTTPTYGHLYLYTSAAINMDLDGDLKVEGNFIMNYDDIVLNDNGYDIDVAGENVQLRNYHPSEGSNFTLSGADQLVYNDGTDRNVYFENLICKGSGNKELTDNIAYHINGNLTINSGITISSTREIHFAGDTWTNNGTFTHTANKVIFESTSNQQLNVGNHTFYGVQFAAGGTKTVVGQGLDVDNGIFQVDAGVTLDLGSYHHYIASQDIDTFGIWLPENASFTFDRGGTQYIPALTAQDITISNAINDNLKYLYMEGHWTIRNLTIEEDGYLRASENNDELTPTYNITLSGNWVNNGRFNAYNDTVFFESTNTTAKTIKANANLGVFDHVLFNQTNTNVVTYNLTDEMWVYDNMLIGQGATLDVNGQHLQLGNDDSNNPVMPPTETWTVEAGGTLAAGPGALIDFDCRDDGDALLDVYGTLRLVGADGNIVKLTRFNGGNRIAIKIQNGGTIAAQYYQLEYLSDSGLIIRDGATINPANNLSNGTFSEMNTGGSDPRYYLWIDADLSSIPDVNNLNFNLPIYPTAGIHYNVHRSETATGTLTFSGQMVGLLAGEDYEDDPYQTANGAPGLVVWPAVSAVTWIGVLNSDWFEAGNWSPNIVPTNSIDATIPFITNGSQPQIYRNGATCKNLTLTDGILEVIDNYGLAVAENVTLGTGNSVATIGMGDNTLMTVNGNWLRGNNAVYSHGDNAVVRFTANAGIVNITPLTSAFGSVEFTGDATYTINGGSLYVDEDFAITGGEVYPDNNNYHYYIGGDFTRDGGDFSTVRSGTVHFNGAGDQSITNGMFHQVDIAGSGTKTTTSTFHALSNLTVSSTLAAASGSPMTFDGNVTIEASGTLNDGDQIHTFLGTRWTGTGSYSGNGKIMFQGGNQEIYAAKFHNVEFNNTGAITLYGDVQTSGDMTVRNTINGLRCNTYQITNTSGTSTFTLEDGEYMQLLGANNFPAGFTDYNMGASSQTQYYATADQTIAGGITYGHLYLNEATTKTLAGDIVVQSNLSLQTASLDAAGYNIEVGGHWTQSTAGTDFTPGTGTVTFNGTADQRIRLNSTGQTGFYNLTIDNAGGAQVYVENEDLEVANNLIVAQGLFNANNRNVSVGGDMLATGGTFNRSGTYLLNKSSGTANIRLNGSELNNLVVNSSATYTLQDMMDVYANFTLTAGTFDANGQTVRLGNNTNTASISGTYIMGSGGRIEMGQYSGLTVEPSGTIYVVGTPGNQAIVTHRDNNYYDFTVKGTIHARYYTFEYMSASGIYITSTASIDPTNNFSNGTFNHGRPAGTFLRIENTQNLQNTNRIESVYFPENPGTGSNNVSKISSGSGIIEFHHASGDFAGEDYDNDPGNLVDWGGPVNLTWTGVEDDDWFNVNNWSADVGGDKIPGIEDVITIPADPLNQPVISQAGAAARSIAIDPAAVLTLNTPADAGYDLQIADDFTIDGMFMMSSNNDTIVVGGDWVKNTGGIFSHGNGSVMIESDKETNIISNQAMPFYNLIIKVSGSLAPAYDLSINNDFIIETGSFDLTQHNTNLTIGGDFINQATLLTGNSLITLNSTSPGIRQIDIGDALFHDLTVNAGSSTSYQLINNDLQIEGLFNLNNGIFDINNQKLELGDNIGADVANISGQLLVGAQDSLLIGANTAINILSGGEFGLVGSDMSNLAVLKNNGTGTYSLTVSSGATFHARYFSIENLDVSGVKLEGGAHLNASNNLSDGWLKNGAPSGRYITLGSGFNENHTINNLNFGSGATYNIQGNGGSGQLTIVDAQSDLAGVLYEDDDLNAYSGNAIWYYTATELSWTGAVDNEACNYLNWEDPSGEPALPWPHTTVDIPKLSIYPQLIVGSEIQTGDLTMAEQAWLTIQAGNVLHVTGDLLLNCPGNSGPTASLVDFGTLTVDGTITVERFIPKKEFHYLTPPVTASPATVLYDPNNDGLNENPNVLYYDEAYDGSIDASTDWDDYIDAWENANPSSTLEAGKAYAVYYKYIMYNFTGGQLNTGDITIPLSYTANDNPDRDGWNLIGNPYPSAIDWDHAGIDKSFIDNTIYFWEEDHITGIKHYTYYNGGGGGTNPYPGVTVNGGTRYIPAMQGFFVHTRTDMGASGSITLDNDARLHDGQIFYKTTPKQANLLRLKATGNDYEDETVIRFLENSTLSFDGQYDAFKLFSNADAVPHLFSLTNDYSKKMAINTLPEINEDRPIPLGLTTGQAGTYELSVTQWEFDPLVTIWLEDRQDEKWTELSPAKSLSVNIVKGDNLNRFFLHISSKSASIDDLKDKTNGNETLIDVQLYSNGKTVFAKITGLEELDGQLKVYDLTGRVVAYKNIQGEYTRLDVNALDGLYIIEADVNGQIYTKKTALMAH